MFGRVDTELNVRAGLLLVFTIPSKTSCAGAQTHYALLVYNVLQGPGEPGYPSLVSYDVTSLSRSRTHPAFSSLQQQQEQQQEQQQ
jgi:hypothetical protein